jgi:hypothetical protein
MRNYILDKNKQPIACDVKTYFEWHHELPSENKTGLGYTVVREQVGEAYVSTVFLGSDHRFDEDKPVLWETMVFWPNEAEQFERYTSEADAIVGHKRIIGQLRSKQPRKDTQ